ncbi:MAG: hypothetical protein ACI9G1_000981, partial [Pirellulaceae bacterium]
LETVRRRYVAKRIANRWLLSQAWTANGDLDIQVNAWKWPVEVRVIARNLLGKKHLVVLRVGGLFGGTIPEGSVRDSVSPIDD